MENKACARCKALVSILLFKPNSKLKDGFSSWCEPCFKAYRLSHVPNKPKLIATISDNKVCRRCSVEKLKSNFRPNPKVKSGLNSWCQECESQYQSNRYVKVPKVPKTLGTKIPKKTKIPKVLVPDGLRKCTKCQALKPASIEHFRSLKKLKCGLTSTCRPCARRRDETYRAENIDRIRESKRYKPVAISKYYMPKPEPIHKKCYSCKSERPISEFLVSGKLKNGNNRYSSGCKPCKNRLSAEYWLKHVKKTERTTIRWTKEQDEYLRNNFDKFKHKELAIQLGLSCSAVQGRTRRLGLKRIKKLKVLKATRKQVPEPTREGHRFCTGCFIEKSFCEFRPHKKSKFGIFARCLSCEARISREKYLIPEVKERKKSIARKSRLSNPERAKARGRNAYRTKKQDPIWVEAQRKKVRKFNKTPKGRQARKNWLKIPKNRMACIIRGSINKALKDRRFTKKAKLREYLGCEIDFFIHHIESQFSSGMTWENHGKGPDKWHIDHIFPIAAAKSEEEVYKLNHYSNLRPMWELENLSKNASYDPVQFKVFLQTLPAVKGLAETPC